MKDQWNLFPGWLTLFLLFVILVSVAAAISAAAWTKGLDNLITTAVFALVAGLFLAQSRFPAVIAHLFSLSYGLFSVGYLVGRLVDEPTWHDRLINLGERIVAWLTKATSGETSDDSLMFVLLLAGLFWFLGHVAAWYTFRRPRLWRVILPAGLTMLVNYYVYTDPRIATRSSVSMLPFVGVFLLAVLLYMVRMNIFLREVEWQNGRVNYSTEIRSDFVRAGVILAAVALLVMAVAPGAQAGPTVQSLGGSFEDFRDDVRSTVARLFASLDTYSRGVANPFTGYIAMGGPRSLGSEVIFDVSAPTGRYWQAAFRDLYTGYGWDTADDQTVVLPPGQSLTTNAWQLRREITQTVTIYVPNTTQLVAAPEPVRVPLITARAEVSLELNKMTSPSTLLSRQPLRPGDTYHIVSAVSQADPETLREAGQAYPDWVSRRYLQLPDTVTDRTRELAREITSGHDNVFDKAQAIEEYLRQNLRYELSVPAPPVGQDFVDFVLFDLEAGYCDYYASSFVVLARTVGIPARIGFGYVQDEYDERIRAYRVRAKNGHSWPEVFFPDYGWIQFEPTVVIDPISWPEPQPEPDTSAVPLNSRDSMDPEEAVEDIRDLLPEERDIPAGPVPDFTLERPFNLSPAFLILVGLLCVTGVGTGFAYWFTEVRGLTGLSLVERAYARMWRLAARLGVPSPPDQTPYERAAALTERVPEGETPIRWITDMYVVERFGRGDGNEDGSGAGKNWTLLRPLLWKSWLQRKLSRFQRPDRERRWRDFYSNGRSQD